MYTTYQYKTIRDCKPSPNAKVIRILDNFMENHNMLFRDSEHSLDVIKDLKYYYIFMLLDVIAKDTSKRLDLQYEGNDKSGFNYVCY